MAQPSVPEGLSGIPDHGERPASQDAAAGASAHLTETGSRTHDQEQPSNAASLCLSLLPEPTAGFAWTARIGVARPLAALTIMGVVAPAATIYTAKAAKYPPTLTAVVVGLELALAYLASRAASRTGTSLRADQRSLPA